MRYGFERIDWQEEPYSVLVAEGISYERPVRSCSRPLDRIRCRALEGGALVSVSRKATDKPHLINAHRLVAATTKSWAKFDSQTKRCNYPRPLRLENLVMNVHFR
jgi:hypothetical protein